jgi:hypothetical protein
VKERVRRIRFEAPIVRDALERGITEVKQKMVGTGAITDSGPIGLSCCRFHRH